MLTIGFGKDSLYISDFSLLDCVEIGMVPGIVYHTKRSSDVLTTRIGRFYPIDIYFFRNSDLQTLKIPAPFVPNLIGFVLRNLKENYVAQRLVFTNDYLVIDLISDRDTPLTSSFLIYYSILDESITILRKKRNFAPLAPAHTWFEYSTKTDSFSIGILDPGLKSIHIVTFPFYQIMLSGVYNPETNQYCFFGIPNTIEGTGCLTLIDGNKAKCMCVRPLADPVLNCVRLCFGDSFVLFGRYQCILFNGKTLEVYKHEVCERLRTPFILTRTNFLHNYIPNPFVLHGHLGSKNFTPVTVFKKQNGTILCSRLNHEATGCLFIKPDPSSLRLRGSPFRKRQEYSFRVDFEVEIADVPIDEFFEVMVLTKEELKKEISKEELQFYKW